MRSQKDQEKSRILDSCKLKQTRLVDWKFQGAFPQLLFEIGYLLRYSQSQSVGNESRSKRNKLVSAVIEKGDKTNLLVNMNE